MQKIEFAKVLKPQGIKGEVKVENFISDLDFLNALKQFYIDNAVYNIKKIRIDGKYAYIQTQEIIDRNQADMLRNKILLADKALLTAKEDEFFISDLENCCVVDEENNIIGYVESVEKYGSADIINILKGGALRSFPFLKAILKEIDLENKKIVVYKDKLDEVLVWRLIY